MSASLQEQYRRALRWYPKAWRRRNEDAVLGTLLDVAAERGELAAAKADLRSLRAHGIQARLGWVGRALTAAVRDRVAAIALGTGMATAIWGVFFSIVDAGLKNGLFPHTFLYLNYVDGTTFGPFGSLDIILYGMWVAVFVTALLGKPNITRILLAATVVAGVVARVLSEQLTMPAYPRTTLVVFLSALAVLGMIGTPRPEARWRLWIGITAIAMTLAQGAILWLPRSYPFSLQIESLFWSDFFNGGRPFITWVVALALGAAALCVLLSRWVWASVLAISSLPWFGLFLIAAVMQRSLGDLLVWFGIIVAVLVIATVISLRVGRIRINVTFTRR